MCVTCMNFYHTNYGIAGKEVLLTSAPPNGYPGRWPSRHRHRWLGQLSLPHPGIHVRSCGFIFPQLLERAILAPGLHKGSVFSCVRQTAPVPFCSDLESWGGRLRVVFGGLQAMLVTPDHQVSSEPGHRRGGGGLEPGGFTFQHRVGLGNACARICIFE